MSSINASQSEGSVLIYDSGSVAGGVAITTPVLDVRRFGQLSIMGVNDHTATRAVNWTSYNSPVGSSAGSGSFTVLLANSVPTPLAWGGGYATSGSNYAAMVGFLSFFVVSGGATTCRLVIWGR